MRRYHGVHVIGYFGIVDVYPHIKYFTPKPFKPIAKSLSKMTSILVIDKTGTIKSVKVKDLTADTLYKKCGFRKADGFERRADWEISIDGVKRRVELWARDDGKANTENKYDFPPPADTALLFGSCALVETDRNDHSSYLDLSESDWSKMYEKLFGGFDDVEDDEEASEDELDDIPASMKTKEGYLKDDFVVGSGDSDEDDDDDDDENLIIDVGDDDDDDDEDDDEDEFSEEEEEDDDSGSELGHEAYEYSDEED